MKRIIFCLLTFMVLSCSKTIEPSLGLYPVYFEVNLNTEWRLQASQASKIFTEKNTNQHDARFGLGGILVYNGFSNNGGSQNVYYAFDAACPYEASSNVTVEVQDGVLQSALNVEVSMTYRMEWAILWKVQQLRSYSITVSIRQIRLY